MIKSIEAKLAVGRRIRLLTPRQENDGVAENLFQRLLPVFLHIEESNLRSRIVGPKTSTVGVGYTAKPHRNYLWLEWREGYVTEVVVRPGVDAVLTGPMSGCWLTLYTRRGEQCVGHVGTAEHPNSTKSVAVKAAWNTFRAEAVGPVTGFNPARNWEGPYPGMKQGDGAPKIFGLVTRTGSFFSVFTYPLLGARDTVRIAGIQNIKGSRLPTKL